MGGAEGGGGEVGRGAVVLPQYLTGLNEFCGCEGVYSNIAVVRCKADECQ